MLSFLDSFSTDPPFATVTLLRGAGGRISVAVSFLLLFTTGFIASGARGNIVVLADVVLGLTITGRTVVPVEWRCKVLAFIPPEMVANRCGETCSVVLLLSVVSGEGLAAVSLVGVLLGLEPFDPVDDVDFSLRVVPDVDGVGEFRALISIDILLYTGSWLRQKKKKKNGEF